MLPWDLEDWLTDEGDKVVVKAAKAGSVSALDARERLLYEVWVLDTEQRNGGISQYFDNRGRRSWNALSRLASAALPSFSKFAAKIDSVIDGSKSAYQAIIDSKTNLDDWYERYSVRLVTELRRAMEDRRNVAEPKKGKRS